MKEFPYTLRRVSGEGDTIFYFSHSLSSLSLSFSFSMPCSVIKCVVYVSTVLNEKCHHPYRGGTSVSCMLWNVERKKYRKFPFSSSTSLMLSLSPYSSASRWYFHHSKLCFMILPPSTFFLTFTVYIFTGIFLTS